ncbi:MAG TPA: substrate-binding domain-containing protein [Magnetospirillaceae bacterium]|nr:substrate-binding domain-containing protein [Magnetospirillaceae bacterium]
MRILERRRNRIILAASVLAAMGLTTAFFLFACRPAWRRAEPSRPPLIGFSLDSLVVERWRRDVDIFTQAAKELGAEVLLKVANQDHYAQELQIRELADAGIHVLVVVPNDANRLSAAIQEVRGRGIRVLSYDRLVRKAGVDLYVSFDNEMVGRLMAQAVSRAVPRGGYIIINGARTDYNSHMINAGIRGVLDPLVESGAIRIVGEIWPENWDNQEVKAALDKIIQVDRDIDAVVAGNDMLAEAAISVLAENRLMRNVRIAGQDAELAACQRIAEGSQYATVYKPIERLALRAAGYAVMLARGEDIQTVAVIHDGQYEVPYVRLEPILVTRDRLDATVIRDGFHRAEDVYRNVRR